jgi:uncharacterized cupredoxin-like copper-binding protein
VRRRALALLPLLAVTLAVGAGCGDDPAEGALGPGNVTVDVDLRHSRFLPAHLQVVEGTTVRFRVRNLDPIDHELIVGGDEVHERHERGTHRVHGALPGEVSAAAGQRAETSFRFDEPGTVVVGCHLPRHFDYGMRGEVEVVPDKRERR